VASFRPSPNVVTGPTRFSGSTHQFTGSVEVSGALLLNGVAVSTGGGGGGGHAWSGTTSNGVVTYLSATTASVQSNFTFDGTTLKLTGTADFTGGGYPQGMISGSALFLGGSGQQNLSVQLGHFYIENEKNNKDVRVKLSSESGESFQVMDSANQVQFDVDSNGAVEIPQGDLTITLGDLTLTAGDLVVGDDIKTAGHLHVGSTSNTSSQQNGTISGSANLYCGSDFYIAGEIFATGIGGASNDGSISGSNDLKCGDKLTVGGSADINGGNLQVTAGNLSCSATLQAGENLRIMSASSGGASIQVSGSALINYDIVANDGTALVKLGTGASGGDVSGSGDFDCGGNLTVANNMDAGGTLIISGTDSGNPDTAFSLCDTDARLLRSNIAGGSGDTVQLKMSNGTIALSASAAIQIYALDGFANSVSVLDSALYVKTTNPGGPPTSHFIATTDAGVGIGAYSIGTGPMVALDVHYSGTLNPTTLPTLNDGGLGAGGGHVAYYGTSSATLQSGSIYYLNSDGGWATATATVTGSGHNQLLGIPLSSSVAGNEGSMSAGILLKGYINIPSDYWVGDFIKGGPVYIQSGSNGFLSGAAPTATDAYVRVVGYSTDTANVIYFDPDATYVEIS